MRGARCPYARARACAFYHIRYEELARARVFTQRRARVWPVTQIQQKIRNFRDFRSFRFGEVLQKMFMLARCGVVRLRQPERDILLYLGHARAHDKLRRGRV